MTASFALPLLVLALVVASDVWVYRDAARRSGDGSDVTVTVGPLTIDRPEHWLVACMLVWVIAFPVYLVARRTST